MTDRSNAETTVDASTSPDERTYVVPTDVDPSVGVVEAVADASGVDPIALPPLQAFVDVDAMNALLDDGPDDVHFTLRYAGRIVEIDGGGSITVGH